MRDDSDVSMASELEREIEDKADRFLRDVAEKQVIYES